MKKLLFIACALVLSFSINAQVKTPQPSPFSKVEQKVGLTDVTFEYSRPGVKGRTIFGDLVPYGKLWRAGANKNTQITFSTDVTIGEQTVKAGTYAIFVTPNAESWEVVFYSDANNWGTPKKWDDSKVAAKVTAQVHEVPFNVETFTIDINAITNSGGNLEFIWEKTWVGVPFSVPTEAGVMASIDKTMAGPGAGDFYSAAVYYLQEGKDLNKAIEWMDKAISMRKAASKEGTEPFWMMRQKSLIHAKLGDKKNAIKAAKKSLSLAKEAGNADYVKMNKDSLKEWM